MNIQLKELYIAVLKKKHRIYFQKYFNDYYCIGLDGPILDYDIHLTKTKYLVEREAISLIENLSINVNYDSHYDLIIVWFYSTNNDPDFVAYLQNNIKWDFRKIKSKVSTLYDMREVIEIEHKRIGTFEINSKFDQIIRKALNQIIEQNEDLSQIEKIKMILNNNSYDI